MDYEDLFYDDGFDETSDYFDLNADDEEILDADDYYEDEFGNKIITNKNKEKLFEKIKKYEKENIKKEEIKILKKLVHIKNRISDENPKELENESFSEYDSISKKEKIRYETLYIRGLMLDSKEMQKNKNYGLYMKLTNTILNSLYYIKQSDYKKIKQCLLLIELELGIDISFYSEVESVYRLKLKQINDEIKKKKGL